MMPAPSTTRPVSAGKVGAANAMADVRTSTRRATVARLQCRRHPLRIILAKAGTHCAGPSACLTVGASDPGFRQDGAVGNFVLTNPCRRGCRLIELHLGRLRLLLLDGEGRHRLVARIED